MTLRPITGYPSITGFIFQIDNRLPSASGGLNRFENLLDFFHTFVDSQPQKAEGDVIAENCDQQKFVDDFVEMDVLFFSFMEKQ
jgi:hypothetical protein